MYIAPPADAAATPCSGGSTGSAAAAASTARRPAGAPTPGCCTSTTPPPPPPGARPKGGVSTSLLLTATDIINNNIRPKGQRNVSPAASTSTMCPAPAPAPGVKSLFNQVNQMLLFHFVATNVPGSLACLGNLSKIAVASIALHSQFRICCLRRGLPYFAAGDGDQAAILDSIATTVPGEWKVHAQM